MDIFKDILNLSIVGINFELLEYLGIVCVIRAPGMVSLAPGAQGCLRARLGPKGPARCQRPYFYLGAGRLAGFRFADVDDH